MTTLLLSYYILSKDVDMRRNKHEINRCSKKSRWIRKNSYSNRIKKTLDIAEKDALEIYVDGEQIILKKYEPACIFCGDARDVVNYKGKNICQHCLDELKK